MSSRLFPSNCLRVVTARVALGLAAKQLAEVGGDDGCRQQVSGRSELVGQAASVQLPPQTCG